MEMFHLRYFVAVAQELNFARAANRLHMAASPLSQRIKDLERELGTALFIRAHHHITLTPPGARLLPLAADVIRRFDDLPAAVHPAGLRRVARVGIAPDVSPWLRSAFLDALRRDHPDVTVELQPASTGPLVRSVLAGDVDFAFVHGPVTRPGLSVRHVHSQPVGVAVARGIGFDDRHQVELHELKDLAYASISHDSAPELYRRVERALTRAGVDRRQIVAGDNLIGLAHLVAAGQAFAIVGLEEGATNKSFHGEPVVILELVGTKLSQSTVAVWLERRADAGDVVEDLAHLAATALPTVC